MKTIPKINFQRFKPYNWQKKAFKIIEECIKSGNLHELVSVAVAVGAGKTALAEFAFGKYILENFAKKTIHFLVAPRRNLCTQHFENIPEMLKEFGLINDVDYKLIQVDCDHHSDFNFNINFNGYKQRHVIFVVCDASLWGEDDIIKSGQRFNRWIGFLNKHLKTNWEVGVIAYDEAHNYNNYVKEMLGLKNSTKNQKSLKDYAKISIFMSSTPSFYQKRLVDEGLAHRVEYNPFQAIKDGICACPNFHLIKGYEETDWPQAILKILQLEIFYSKNEAFSPRILVNFNNIKYIHQFIDRDDIQKMIGKDFHIIVIHTYQRNVPCGENSLRDYTCYIDHLSCKSDKALKQLRSLDTKRWENNLPHWDDDLPVIVCQVNMIGEGINIKCFNAILTASSSEIKQIQQMGRGMRNYKINGLTKIDHGHLSVYFMYDNQSDIERLVTNLFNNKLLTDDNFDWVKRIDVSKGSGVEIPFDSELTKGSDADWILTKDLPKIKQMFIDLIAKIKKKEHTVIVKDFICNFEYDDKARIELNKALSKKYLKAIKCEGKNESFILQKITEDAFMQIKKDSSLKKYYFNNELNFFKYAFHNDNLAIWYVSHMTSSLRNEYQENAKTLKK